MEDDASKNPEADNFAYVYMILEALSKLGHLEAAVDKMEQRLPVELFTIVDRTNQEVDLRHPLHSRSLRIAERGLWDFDVGGSDSRKHVLNDLLWTLYSKFEAIAEGHRVVHDVIVGIARREGLRDRNRLVGGFDELWKLYQSEVSSATPFWTKHTNSSRYDLYCMIILQRRPNFLLDLAECRKQKPMSSKRSRETRTRHECSSHVSLSY